MSIEYVEKMSMSLGDFKAWSGAIDRLETIKRLDLVEQAEMHINAMLEGQESDIEASDINDILWFEMDDFIEENTPKELQEINEGTLDDFKTYEGYEGSYIVEPYIRHKEFDTVIDYGEDLEELMLTYEDNEDVFYYYIGLDGKAYAPKFGGY